MKIFQVINVRWFNATAWYALYLGKLLAADGHEVLIITIKDSPVEAKAREWGLDVVCMDLNTSNPLRLAQTGAQMMSLLRARRPDVVNCHRGESFFLWALFKKLGFGYRLVRTRGDQRLPRFDILNRLMHNKIADAVVVTNRLMANHFLKKMQTPENRLWLIHGGVDSKTFTFDAKGREAVRQEFGYEPHHQVVGLLGRFDRVKGHKELIESVALLRKGGMENVRLFLIGFDTAMSTDEINAEVKKHGLEDITRISGKREDVAACLSALDVGVVASLWSETIARSALEIMAVGCPLASTDVGVMPDLVPSQVMVPAGDTEAMAHVIGQLLTDEEFRTKTLAAHKRTMSQLTGKEFLRRTISVYRG